MREYRVEISWEHTCVDYGPIFIYASSPEEARQEALENHRQYHWEPDCEVIDGKEIEVVSVEEYTDP